MHPWWHIDMSIAQLRTSRQFGKYTRVKWHRGFASASTPWPCPWFCIEKHKYSSGCDTCTGRFHSKHWCLRFSCYYQILCKWPMVVDTKTQSQLSIYWSYRSYSQPNMKIADPMCTFVFSIIVMMTTCTIMKESIGIILESVPNSVNTERLTKDLRCIDGVRSVHNLCVWSLTVGHNLMSVHLITGKCFESIGLCFNFVSIRLNQSLLTWRLSLSDPFTNAAEVLYVATTIATKGYNIKQCTIQVESISAFESAQGNIEQNRNHAKAQTQPMMAVDNVNSESIISILAWIAQWHNLLNSITTYFTYASGTRHIGIKFSFFFLYFVLYTTRAYSELDANAD